MPIDFSIKATDIAIVFATLVGPFLAVYVTELQRKNSDSRNRKIHIFRNLMATRSATLVASHIEALNLVEVEFDSKNRLEREVVDAWRLYLAHLNDHQYPRESWDARRADLLIELLFSMSKALGYSYGKSEIRNGTYYPQGYVDVDTDNLMTRKLWLEVLQGHRQLPVKFDIPTQE